MLFIIFITLVNNFFLIVLKLKSNSRVIKGTELKCEIRKDRSGLVIENQYIGVSSSQCVMHTLFLLFPPIRFVD